jgi:hypothetical protein
MDERFVFWKWYKRSIYALGALGLITMVSSTITGDLSSVLDVGGEGNSTRIIVYQIAIFSIFLLFIAMGGIGSIFCFGKIIKLVWTTSSKIAKLLRTDDRQLVFALRRRMYAYISAAAFCSLLSVIEFNLLGVFYVCGTIIILQVALHFLEFVRLGVKNLDEYELREGSISEDVECEGVSQMSPIKPLSPSELEPENEGKQKKWFRC